MVATTIVGAMLVFAATGNGYQNTASKNRIENLRKLNVYTQHSLRITSLNTFF
jgi:hypothetical protein